MIWTALIPVAESAPGSLVPLACDSRLPEVTRLIARRLGEDVDPRPAPLETLLSRAADRPAETRLQVVAGLIDAMAGSRKARKPVSWDAFRATFDSAKDPTISAQLRELNVLFGDGRALEEVKRLALDDKADLATRQAALRTLIENRPTDLRAICERLVRVRYMNAVAVRGLALFDDPEIGQSLARSYGAFHPSERPAALEVLVSRPASPRRFSRRLPREKSREST